MYLKYFKPIIDLLASMMFLIILSPIFILLGIILSISFKGSPFFTQIRPGKNSRLIKVIKFKTMNDKRDGQGNLLPDAHRLTTIGRFVRKTSLDEIPQLINVLKGEMSLIGPRPLAIEYLPLYSAEQIRRHDVRPGISGWAQVNGRNLMKLSKKFEYDVWYVEHLSFYLDLKIILLTIFNVIKSKDVGVGAENMEEVDDLNFQNRINNQ
jgi:lipopolysaccharide/colanic/teichoic acid biosynthesis glycosyltransferase